MGAEFEGIPTDAPSPDAIVNRVGRLAGVGLELVWVWSVGVGLELAWDWSWRGSGGHRIPGRGRSGKCRSLPKLSDHPKDKSSSTVLLKPKELKTRFEVAASTAVGPRTWHGELSATALYYRTQSTVYLLRVRSWRESQEMNHCESSREESPQVDRRRVHESCISRSLLVSMLGNERDRTVASSSP